MIYDLIEFIFPFPDACLSHFSDKWSNSKLFYRRIILDYLAKYLQSCYLGIVERSLWQYTEQFFCVEQNSEE